MHLLAAAAVLLTAVLVPAPAQAAGDWEVDFAPYYAWLMGLDGSLSVRGAEADVDLSFSDLADNLDFLFTSHVEARKSGWGFGFEPNYYELGTREDTPTGTFRTKTKVWFIEGFGMRRWGDSGRFTDFLFGARYVSLDQHIEPAGHPDVSGTEEWVDPFLGARFGGEISKSWWASFRADIGGFGVGSDFAWQAALMFGWRFNERAALLLGYRHLDMDYEDGSGQELFRYDAYLSGPLVGFNIYF